jgi:hypothetical protein
MAQLGSGGGSHYPSAIDTRQIYQNTVSAAPDSDTRVDAEYLNDTLTAILQIETALGAGVQGSFGSLAARLAALESGGTGLTNVVPFASQTSVLLPGVAHQQGSAALLYQIYDASVPRQALQPDTFSVFPTTYDAVATFGVPQSGIIMVAVLEPHYLGTFTTTGTPPTAVIPGTAHALAETYLFFQAFDTANPSQAIELGSLGVNTLTFDVTLTTAVPMTGTLLLCVGSPRYAQAFVDQTSVSVPASVHGLGSAHLLYQVYAPGGVEPQAIPAGGLTLNHTTGDVVLTFAAPQSGTLVLAPVPSVTPPSLLAVLPMARAVPVPLIATRTVVEERFPLAAQANVETLAARLQELEAAYATLATQLSARPPEETPA